MLGLSWGAEALLSAVAANTTAKQPMGPIGRAPAPFALLVSPTVPMCYPGARLTLPVTLELSPGAALAKSFRSVPPGWYTGDELRTRASRGTGGMGTRGEAAAVPAQLWHYVGTVHYSSPGKSGTALGQSVTMVGYSTGTVLVVLGHPGMVLGHSWVRLELSWYRSRQCWNIWDSAGAVWNCLRTGLE